jgi:hypothetical protein
MYLEDTQANTKIHSLCSIQVPFLRAQRLISNHFRDTKLGKARSHWNRSRYDCSIHLINPFTLHSLCYLVLNCFHISFTLFLVLKLFSVEGRAFHSSAVVGNCIYFFGGYNGLYYLSDVYIFNTGTVASFSACSYTHFKRTWCGITLELEGACPLQDSNKQQLVLNL